LRYLIACRIGPRSVGCKPVMAARLIQHQGKFLVLAPHFHFLWHWPGFVTRKTWCILLLKIVLQVFPPIRIVLRVVLNTADSQGTNYFVCVFHARNSQLSRLYVSLHVILRSRHRSIWNKKLQTTAEINTMIKASKYLSYFMQKNTSSGGNSRSFERGTLAFYGSNRFVSVLTTAFHQSLSPARLISLQDAY